MAVTASADRAEIFAANRARGRVMLAVAARGGATRRARVMEEGSLRVRCPGPPGRALEAVLVNTAGGIAGGDRLEIEIAAAEAADLTVTSAAAEKIYRSLGPEASINIRLAAAAGSTLVWLPQETILFDQARLRRTIDMELVDDAHLVLAEALVFGRAAMGETVQQGALFDRWRIRRGGRLVFAETVRLDGAIRENLNHRAVAAGAAAIATLLIVPGDDTHVAAVRGCAGMDGEVAASAWNGLALVRFLSPDGAALRHDVSAALAALGVARPRLWLN